VRSFLGSHSFIYIWQQRKNIKLFCFEVLRYCA
jgi:hypothetical protein